MSASVRVEKGQPDVCLFGRCRWAKPLPRTGGVLQRTVSIITRNVWLSRSNSWVPRTLHAGGAELPSNPTLANHAQNPGNYPLYSKQTNIALLRSIFLATENTIRRDLFLLFRSRVVLRIGKKVPNSNRPHQHLKAQTQVKGAEGGTFGKDEMKWKSYNFSEASLEPTSRPNSVFY